MSAATPTAESRLRFVATEVAKLPAFVRRDFLEALSYRTAFVSDAVGLAVQTVTFFYVGRMVDPDVLPSYGGGRVTYLEFVVVGIAITMFLSLGLGRVAAAMRNEQLTGTLESVLMTPTAPGTIQLGSVVYDLLYVPLRTAIFLGAIVLAFDVRLDPSGLLPATLALVAFIPFVWGLGIASAAALLTFKRGTGGIGLGVTLLTLGSGAYFPLSLFPGWVAWLARYNPMAVAIDVMRDALLGDAGLAEVGRALVVLVPAAGLTLAGGVVAFRLALRRERRAGTLGLY